MQGPLVSVIVPAFNEEETIEDVLTRVQEVLESERLPCEVIVVDDGSTDRTKELASRCNAIVLSNTTNRGKGCALRKGFKHASGDIIVTMDADGSHDPKDITRLMMPILGGADIVLGSRFADDQGKASTTRFNVLGNMLINLAIMLMTGKYVSDSQTGFRAFKKEAMQEIEVESKGYQVETEMTVKTLRNGSVIREVPIKIKERLNGHTHLDPLLDGLRILRTLLWASVTDQHTTELSHTNQAANRGRE